MKELDPETAARIDAQSEKLQDEFLSHAAELAKRWKAKRPDLLKPDGTIDMRTAFEGWAIQRIANLQVLVLDLVERVQELEQRRGRGSSLN